MGWDLISSDLVIVDCILCNISSVVGGSEEVNVSRSLPAKTIHTPVASAGNPINCRNIVASALP